MTDSQDAALTHQIIPLSQLQITYTVNGRTPLGLFDDPTDDMIRQYIIAKWSISDPDKSMNPPADFSTNVRFADFDYDYFATYHVMIKQDEPTIFNNDFVGQGMLQFYDPILIEISARRLTYGKIFEQMDNIRNEIVRILGQYDPDEISGVGFMSGVQAIEIIDPGDIQPMSQFINKLPRTIWRAQVKCMVHYFINYY